MANLKVLGSVGASAPGRNALAKDHAPLSRGREEEGVTLSKNTANKLITYAPDELYDAVWAIHAQTKESLSKLGQEAFRDLVEKRKEAEKRNAK